MSTDKDEEHSPTGRISEDPPIQHVWTVRGRSYEHKWFDEMELVDSFAAQYMNSWTPPTYEEKLERFKERPWAAYPWTIQDMERYLQTHSYGAISKKVVLSMLNQLLEQHEQNQKTE